jgi:hypothetical protein
MGDGMYVFQTQKGKDNYIYDLLDQHIVNALSKTQVGTYLQDNGVVFNRRIQYTHWIYILIFGLAFYHNYCTVPNNSTWNEANYDLSCSTIYLGAVYVLRHMKWSWLWPSLFFFFFFLSFFSPCVCGFFFFFFFFILFFFFFFYKFLKFIN